MDFKRVFNKLRFLKSDFFHKRSFLNIKEAFLYTLAPYTPPLRS